MLLRVWQLTRWAIRLSSAPCLALANTSDFLVHDAVGLRGRNFDSIRLVLVIHDGQYPLGSRT
jgi:hypothetical protein